MITTVILPLLSASATIREAIQRLTESRRSAVVIRDERGPVVVTDRSLLNTLISEGEQPLSRVADQAFPGVFGRTVLADAQRKYIVTGFKGADALVDADADAAEELQRPSAVEFPAPRTITTVELPLLSPEATVHDAVRSLRDSGRSAIVIGDKRGPVVVTDRFLLDFLDAPKANPHQSLSRVSDQAFPGVFGTRTDLAKAQRQYIVKEIQGGTARVDTDAEVAQRLAQPSTLAFP